MPVDDVPAEARRLIFGDVPDIQIFGVGDGVRGGGRVRDRGGRTGEVMQSSTLSPFVIDFGI